MIKILRLIKGNNSYFMNFGYWKEDNLNLEEAFKKLPEYMLEQGQFHNDEKILDVGIGYGEQDKYWINEKKIKGNITGIDINPKQIEYTKKIIAGENLSKRIQTQVGNATNLEFDNDIFDTVLSVESAFHYKPRKQFFKESYRVLKPGGKLVIADIMYKEHPNCLKKMILSLYNGFLDIPEENCINTEEWVKELEDIGYHVTYNNITNETFIPYFNYFMNNCDLNSWFVKKVTPYIVGVFKQFMPYNYIVAVCQKK